MKTTAFSLAFGALLASYAAADQVRVTVRVIEVPLTVLTKWTGGTALKGRDLHERAVKLALAGEAEIVETNVLTVRSGEKGLLESIAEIIYPAEREASDGLDQRPVPPLTPEMLAGRYLRPSDALSTFETRNTGVTLEIEPTAAEDGKMIDLRLSLEVAARSALTTWTEFRDQWGDGSLRTPVFDSQRLISSITLADGAVELFNIFTPKPAAVPAATTRLMVFVSADVLPSPKKQ